MINQKPIVYNKLKELVTDHFASQVCEEGSQDWSKLPCVTYYELQNEPSDYVEDDEEYSSALSIKADVWGKTSSEVSRVSMQVVSKMRDLGYERTFYLDVIDTESKVKHKSLRFEKIEFLEEE